MKFLRTAIFKNISEQLPLAVDKLLLAIKKFLQKRSVVKNFAKLLKINCGELSL